MTHPPRAGASWRSLLVQAVVLGLLAGLALWLGANTLHNLQQRHVSTGLGFLFQPSSLPIADSVVAYDPQRSTFAAALWVGVLNTLVLSLCVILTATVLGTVIGLSRLSPNWLARTLAATWVGVIRNVPALLVVLFVMSQMRRIGGPRQAIALPGGAFLSNRGLIVPSLTEGEGLGWIALAFFIGMALGMFLAHRFAAEPHAGRAAPAPWLAGLTAGTVLALIAFAAVPLRWQVVAPALRGFNFVGGTVISLEFCAMLCALTAYFSAYIAETVRSGVLAVPTGQWDAAMALGLSRKQTLRLIVTPLAMRVIVPPITNSYLGIVKASSLGVAIGYQELVSVTNTALSMTGQSIELVFILMSTYLVISLAIGWVAHRYNERVLAQGLR